MKTQTKLTKEDPLNLTRFQELKEKRASAIVAQVIVSESELDMIIPNYTSDYEDTHKVDFLEVLFNLGMDISKGYNRQDNLMHRNRLNKIVICNRWVGESRIDPEWINSGYASREAKDKYCGSKILEDLYRERNETRDTQDYLEGRDKYAVVDESLWINE